MNCPRYWRDSVENDITHISEEFGAKLTTPETEEEARNLYLFWLKKLALRGEDL